MKWFNISNTSKGRLYPTFDGRQSTSGKERKSFTNVANNFSLSGIDSRHGFRNEVKENKTEKMTLEQAIFSLEKWLALT
jgi:hypothetical protein